jgi:hypothetical protein
MHSPRDTHFEAEELEQWAEAYRNGRIAAGQPAEEIREETAQRIIYALDDPDNPDYTALRIAAFERHLFEKTLAQKEDGA